MLVDTQLHAVVLLRESDSSLVQPGDRVRVALDRAPELHLHGEVVEIGLGSATGNGESDDATDLAIEAGLRKGLDYDAMRRLRVQLDPLAAEAAAVAQHGAIGQVRIVTGRESLGGRLARWARQAFHFQ